MLSLPVNALYTPHIGQAGGRGLSPRLWSRMIGQSMSPDGLSNAFMVGDDFLSCGLAAATMFISEAGLYSTHIDTSCTVLGSSTVSGGAVNLFLDGTGANDECGMQSGNGVTNLGAISNTAGSDKLTIFEVRFKISQIASGAVFIGLMEEGCNVADAVIADAGNTMAAKDHIGFFVKHGAPTTMTFQYAHSTDTVVQVEATFLDADGDAVVLKADTWYKAGFVYDPKAEDSKKIRIYFDNVEQSSYVTTTLMDVTATTRFPDGEEMAFVASTKNPAEATKTVSVDWWAYYQGG